MKWDPATLVTFARGAQFPENIVPYVVAMAVVSSGGHDTYHQTAGIAGAGDWRGLWALDVDRYPDWAKVDLYVPENAAHAAWWLTCDRDGFGWCGAYRSRACAPYVPLARAAMGRTPHREQIHSPVSVELAGRYQ